MIQPDSDALLVRPAVLHDLAELVAIDALCFPPGIAYPHDQMAALLRARSVLTLLAESSTMIAGFAALRILPSRHLSMRQRTGELITIDVLPEFRRKRAGWQLHGALEEWLRAGNGSRMELHVAVDNTGAMDFYRRLGYTVTERVPRYYRSTLDAWRMEKLV